MAQFLTYTAVYVLLEKGGKGWFLRRANTGYRDGQYSLPAGHVEAGENLHQAAVRELREETGLEVTVRDVALSVAIFRQNPDRTYNDYFFVCHNWQGEPRNTEPEKCDDAGWFDLKDLPANLVPEVKEALRCIVNGEKFLQLDLRKEEYRDAAH